MTETKNYFAYHKSIDAINDALIGDLNNKTLLAKLDKRVEKLAELYGGDEQLGKQRYKLFQAQGLIYYHKFDDAKAAKYLAAAMELYGGTIPGSEAVVKELAKSLEDSQPVSPYAHYPVLKLTHHTGMLLAWQQQYFEYQGPPELLRKPYYKALQHNLFLGWWSLYSLFLLNPYVILANWVRWEAYKFKARKLISNNF